MFKRITYILLAMLILTQALPAAAAGGTTPPKSVRIGLVTYFEYVETIHMYNDTIAPGFYKDDMFYPEATIRSDGHDFWFTPTTKYYLASEQTFDSYEAASDQVALLRESGHKAYATLIDIGTWKVYAGHSDSEEDLDSLLAVIDGLYDITYVQAEESYERLMMESEDNDPVIFENSGKRTSFWTADKRSGVSVIDLGKRSYRGLIEVGRYGRNDLTAVNIIDLDDYLNSVVVSEVYASWPEESLKAQAVAARTFAVYYKEVVRKYPNDPFDLDDTIGSQVYKGYSIEDSRVNDAVAATSGVMVYYDGRVIPTYFFAASGGRTENSENVWTGTVPYLKSVPDIYETQPERAPWLLKLTASEIESKLGKKGIDIGSIKDVEAVGYTDAGRVLELKIIGTSGSHTLKKENMRYVLGINSRKFVLIKEDYEPETAVSVVGADGDVGYISYDNAHVISQGGSHKLLAGHEQILSVGAENIHNQPLVSGERNTFIFAGEGWGHGVGMSQAGAKGMANAGFTYVEILEHYYTGVEVK